MARNHLAARTHQVAFISSVQSARGSVGGDVFVVDSTGEGPYSPAQNTIV